MWHSIARANKEEYSIVKEMQNIVQHYLDKLQAFDLAIQIIDIEGNPSLLVMYRRKCIADIMKLDVFLKYVDLPELSHFLTES